MATIPLILFIIIFLDASLCLATNNFEECPYGYSVCNTSIVSAQGLCCLDGCCKNFKECYYEVSDKPLCICFARTKWTKTDLKNLEIEYIHTNRETVVIGSESTPSILQHNNGNLTKLPRNICRTEQLLWIELQENQLETIGNISCLTDLDTLDLSGNQISNITNTTFIGLSSLRSLNLANNKITYLDPGTLIAAPRSLVYMDFSYNVMLTLDISNMLLKRPFCSINYSYNNISELENDLGLILEDYEDIGDGGFIDMRFNQFTNFFGFEKLGINTNDLLKVRHHAIDFRESPFDCNCMMVEFLQKAADFLQKIYREHFDVKCSYPPSLRGQSIPQLVLEKKLDLFICEISLLHNCPFDCYCFEQPSQNRIVVNCSSRGLDTMPLVLPMSRPLEIDLSNNYISVLSERNYLNRTKILDLKNNQLVEIQEGALKTMDAIAVRINLQGNGKLRRLPTYIQKYNPCIFIFGVLKINCNCENLWYGSWIRYHRLENCSYNTYLCVTSKETRHAREVTTEILECSMDSKIFSYMAILFSLCSVVIIAASLVLKLYFFELYILYKSSSKCNNMRNRMYSEKKFDVYISYNDDNGDLFQWVRYTLVETLERCGYRVCLPCREYDVGNILHEEVRKNILLSKNVLILLSEKPDKPLWSSEWKWTWKAYKESKIRDIIFINYDHISGKTIRRNYNSVYYQPLRAFHRLGKFMDFSNMNNTLMEKIRNILGPVHSHAKYTVNTRESVSLATFPVQEINEN